MVLFVEAAERNHRKNKAVLYRLAHLSQKTEFQAVSSYLNKLYNIYDCKTPVRPATGNYRLGVCEKSVGNG